MKGLCFLGVALICADFFSGCATNKLETASTEKGIAAPGGCIVAEPTVTRWWEYALLPVSVPFWLLTEGQKLLP